MQQVRITLLGADVVVQDTFLQGGQRVDVLHIRRTARYVRDDTFDGRLVELHQRQHRRRDARAPRGNAIGRHHDFPAAAHCGCQRRQAWLAEQDAYVTAQADLAHALDQADRQQRMPAQFEEMIVTPDPLELEHVLPDLRQPDFHLAFRCFETTAEQSPLVRHRQALAVELAVGSERQQLQPHIGRRHHVVRQLALQMGTQRLDTQRRTGGVVGDQAFVARFVFPDQHHGVFHAWEICQAGFDLAGFDTEAPHLHLQVIAASVQQSAIGLPAGQVTTAVQHAFTEGVGNEFLGGQLRLVQVPLGHARAADVQLAHHAQRHRLLACIQHVGLGVGDWPADRDPALAHVGDLEGGRKRGGFGGPITVEQVLGLAVFEYPANHLRVEHVTADDQVAQLTEYRHQRVGVLVEQPGSHPQHADGLLLQQRCKGGLGQQHCVVDHHHTTAIEQRRPHIEGAGVERRVGGERHAVLRVELGIAVIEHQARDGAMGHLHTLGRPGGTGGVENVGDAFGRLGQLRVARRQGFQVQVGQRVEHPVCATVLHDKRLALDRRVDVQRHIHRGALEDRQLADQQVERTRQRNRDAFARLHPLVEQVMGQPVGATVEVAVTQGQGAMHGRHRFRTGQRLGLEQLMHGQVRWVFAGGSVEVHQQLMTFGRRQDRDGLQGCGGRLLQRHHQMAQRGEHVVAYALDVQGRHALYGQGKACAQVIDVEHQRVVAALFGAEDLDAGSRERTVPRRLPRCTVAIVEQGAEQRQRTRHATATLGQGQRRVLMPEQLRQACVGGAHTGLHTDGAQADAQRQGVDEHPQRPVGPLAALHAPQQHSAEHHGLLAGHLPQHLCPGQVHQARRAHPQLPRLFAQAQAQCRFQWQVGVDNAAAVAIHVLQTEGQGRLVDIAEHFAEERFVLCLADPKPRLGHVVAVLHGGRQLCAVAGQARAHFFHQHLQGGVVQQDVVQQQDTDEAALFLGVGETHQ